VAAVVGCAALGGLVELPTPYLFAAFVVGIVYALGSRVPLLPPRSVNLGAQAVIGVIVGTYVQRSTLSEVGATWAPVLGVCLATLALSVVTGIVLARVAPVDQATASFGMIAGGAAGIIAIARELHADERIVAVLQYLRVLIIVAVTPLVATLVFGIEAAKPPTSHLDTSTSVLFLLGCGGAGVALARAARLPAGAILGPMFVACACTLAGFDFAVAPPAAVIDAAFTVIGLEVGLRFTPSSIAQARAVLPAAVAMTLVTIAVSALLGVALSATANVSALDGYLATTPGGLSAVLALAVGSRTNTTFVVSVQVLRTILMLVAAPPLARWIAHRRRLEVSDSGARPSRRRRRASPRPRARP
jgi:membrane AbrB-like protein